jgi:hypothetical protein
MILTWSDHTGCLELWTAPYLLTQSHTHIQAEEYEHRSPCPSAVAGAALAAGAAAAAMAGLPGLRGLLGTLLEAPACQRSVSNLRQGAVQAWIEA